MNTPCPDTIQPELKAYLDGQLPYLLRLRVRRHLRRCAACREELAAMEQISNELRADGPEPLDAALRARILNAVACADTPSTPLTAVKASRRQRKPLLLLGGIATVLVAWITLYPVLHGDMRHTIMAGTPAAQDASGASQLKAATPTMPAPGAMASGKAVPALSESAKMDKLKTRAPEAQVLLNQDMERAGTARAAVQPSTPKIVAQVMPESRNRAMAKYANEQMAGGRLTGNAKKSRQVAVVGGGFATQRPTLSTMNANATVSIVGSLPTKTAASAPTIPQQFAARVSRGKTNAANDLQDENPVPRPMSLEAGEAKAGRQVRREATLTVQVDNVEEKSESATQYAQTAGGFIANNALNTGDDNLKTAALTLKVPVTQFEMVLGQVARLGEVKAKNVTGEDLTERISDQQQSEHVLQQDINTTQQELTHRLSNAGRQERLDTLHQLRTRVAQAQARLQLLRKLGALSTITLELTEKPHSAPPPAPKTGGFVSDMNDTLHAAIRSMTEAARLPILTFIWILAYAPLWLLLLLGYRYAVRR